MKILSAALLFGAFALFGQDHHAGVNQRGDQVMGFSHEKTTHHSGCIGMAAPSK